MITDIIVGLAFLLLVLLGFFRGFIKSVVMLVKIPVTIVVSFLAAGPLSGLLKLIGFQSVFAGWTGLSEQTAGIIVLIALAVIIFIVIRLILWKLVKISDKAKENKRMFSKADRFLGLLFGLVHFTIIFTLVSIVFFFFTLIPFFTHWNEAVFEGSHVAKWLYNIIVQFVVEQAYAALPGAPAI
jgi:uncharacterized membrane protein required for colicin V production